MLRRTRIPACLLACAALLVPASSAQAGVTACASAAVNPAPGVIELTRTTTLCLLNRERQARGLRSLHLHRRLTRAATGHSSRMVNRDFFAHGNFVARILNARYATRRQRWTLGENLAWGTGSLASPAKTVEAWMHSPGHRANILNGRFRHVGIGIALGAPGHGGEGATYTTDFGSKS